MSGWASPGAKRGAPVGIEEGHVTDMTGDYSGARARSCRCGTRPTPASLPHCYLPETARVLSYMNYLRVRDGIATIGCV